MTVLFHYKILCPQLKRMVESLLPAIGLMSLVTMFHFAFAKRAVSPSSNSCRNIALCNAFAYMCWRKFDYKTHLSVSLKVDNRYYKADIGKLFTSTVVETILVRW